MTGKRLLLIVSGGIAAYKCLELIRRLRERDVAVRCILTRGGAEFVTPLSLASLTGEKVYADLFSLTDEAEMGHIRLSREADLVLVAPASADIMAKMAHGHADDLATTALLATDKPVIIAPAMNTRMWEHTATRRNLDRLRHDGVHVIEPGAGDLACGEVGAGRLADVPVILDALEQFFRVGARPLDGRHVLVTAGPTIEAIDPVRYIANRSSGKQGYAVAAALANLGARVTLISGPVSVPVPPGVERVGVESARDMMAAARAALPADAAVCVAAVADWRAEVTGDQKIKKAGGPPPALTLVENPDILATLSALQENRPALVVGFAAETESLIEHARAKRARKGCDWIVANDVAAPEAVMGGDHNTVHLITEAGVENWPRATKADVAARLAQRIAETLIDNKGN
ncbi:MAG: bifunctional phosphopantothenoylcysteine decarboxylase/phosphopantothenate--cysteine ligase CoaBC [Sphingomonadales bacterium]